MDDYYHHFLTSVSGVRGHPVAKTDESNISTLPNLSISAPESAMQNPHHYLQHLASFPDQHHLNNSSTGKARKKSMTGPAFGLEHVKHRRTRSGCFMCRSRRIKEDKIWTLKSNNPQPGCKKGNRDCVYPDPPTSKSAKLKDGSALPQAQRTSSKSPKEGETGDEDQDMTSLDTIMDEDELVEESSPDGVSDSHTSECCAGSSSTQDLARHKDSADSVSPNANKKLRLSIPDGYVSTATPSPDLKSLPTEGHVDWSHLPSEYQHYLNYFVENITSFHYSIPHDEANFFGRILPSLAVYYEPLLNAVVGFSAYHATLQDPNGQIQEFLKYYNRSVTLLLESINTKKMDNVFTLEYFGDWINLTGHQKAAFQVICKLYNPESILETAIGRACLDWYSRYDCFVALMGGFPTDMPKEWFDSMNTYYKSRVLSNPDDLNCKISLRSTELRTISYEMSMLYARGSRGQIETEEFLREHSNITEKLLEWKSTWESILLTPEYLVTDFSYRIKTDPEDIVDPYMPGLLYTGPLFTTTLINTEWESIMIMHLSQSSDAPAEQVFAEMAKHAYTVCQYFETVEYWPLKPKGALIPLQCCLSLASLFLPRDLRHQMWARRKLAMLETMGLIYPTAQRQKVAHLFRDPSLTRWWLPDDEGLTPVLQAVRAFTDERNTAAVNTQFENIREVRHLFAKLEAAEMTLMQADHGNVITRP
ncbi:hypothetical protein E4U24_006305 [Claviceps purpurea]|nr:hypothetical protein E4U24_006305 [Claviceps purpurea]